MSQLSTAMKKWETEISTWFKGIEPTLETDLNTLAAQFKSTIGPSLMAAAESAVAELAEAATGTLTGPALVTNLEALGKNLLVAIEATVKTLAGQGITAAGTQILGAVATQLAVQTAVAAAASNTPPSNESAQIIPGVTPGT